MPQSLLLDLIFPFPDQDTFTYILPDYLKDINTESLTPGQRFLVSLGKRRCLAYLGRVYEGNPAGKKPVLKLVDQISPFTPELLDLAGWLTQNYFISRGEALATIFPLYLGRKQKVNPPSFLSSLLPFSFNLTDAEKAKVEGLFSEKDFNLSKPALILLRSFDFSQRWFIYRQLIEQVLGKGKQILFLLPGINFARRIYANLRQDFPDKKTGFWSGEINPGWRYHFWNQVRRGEVDIVVGTRSAVFLPFRTLGLCILEDPANSGYWEQRRPHYQVQPVAFQRCQKNQAHFIIGGVLPDLSIPLQKKSAYSLKVLTSTPINFRVVPSPFNKQVLTRELREAVTRCFWQGDKVLLLVGGRGFARVFFCRECGWISRCPDCGVAQMVQIKAGPADGEAKQELICPYCAKPVSLPVTCPSCQGGRFQLRGIGSQRVEKELQGLLPDVSFLRIDQDILEEKGQSDLLSKINDFETGKQRILLATPLVLNLLSPGKLALVGVVNFDAFLFRPDYRSEERAAELLGKLFGLLNPPAESDKMLVVTRFPKHPFFRQIQGDNWTNFIEEQKELRRELGYPPAKQIYQISLRGKAKEKVQGETERLLNFLKINLPQTVTVFSPEFPAYRKEKTSRGNIVIKGPFNLNRQLFPLLRRLPISSSLQLSVSLDPPR